MGLSGGRRDPRALADALEGIMPVGEARVLVALAWHGAALDMTSLSSRTGMPKPKLSPVVARLRGRGVVGTRPVEVLRAPQRGRPQIEVYIDATGILPLLEDLRARTTAMACMHGLLSDVRDRKSVV